MSRLLAVVLLGKTVHERLDIPSVHGGPKPLGDLALAVHEESLRPGSHATRRRRHTKYTASDTTMTPTAAMPPILKIRSAAWPST